MDAPVETIAKLLRLAEGKGTTPAEAATAAAQAQRLMDRYKLTRAAVDDHERPEAIERDHEALVACRRLAPWRGVLASGVAFSNDCRLLSVTSRRRQRRLELVGRPSSVAVARYLYAYLAREIDRLAREGLRRQNFGDDAGAARAWGANFRLGAAAEMSLRLSDERASVRQEASRDASAALVRLDQHAVELDSFTRSIAPNDAPPMAAPPGGFAARIAGRRAARSIALRQGLEPPPRRGRPLPEGL